MEEKRAKMSMKVPATLLAIIILMIGFKLIYDNPNILKLKNEKESEKTTLKDKYVIETDSRYQTMRNDGGSYESIYYEIDFVKKEIIKKKGTYTANLTGTPTLDEEVEYTKKMDDEISKEVRSILSEVIKREDTNPSENYLPYTITHNEEEKLIYNENTIKELKELLTKLDGDSVDGSARKLLFRVSSNALKCLSPVLYVYSDKTYELYDTHSTNGEAVEPKRGSYNYDVNLILSNIAEFEDQGMDYIIEDSNNQRHGFNSYAYLEDFLNEIGIKIKECTMSE